MSAEETESSHHGARSLLIADSSRSDSRPARIALAVTRYGVPALILTLPLEFTAQLFKLQLARIVLLVVALAFLYLVVTGKRTVIAPTVASAGLVVAYVVASVVSWLVTRAPGSINALLDVTAYPVMVLLIISLVRSEDDVRNAWLALIVSGVLFAILGVFLYVTHISIWRADLSGLNRVNATFGDPNIAARFLTLTVSASILLFAARARRSWLAAAGVAAGAAIVPLTFSKSAYLIFPATMVLMAPFGIDRRRAAAMAALAIVVFAASVVVNPATRDRAVVSLGLVSGTTQNGGSTPLNEGDTAPLAGGRLDTVRTYLIEAGWAMFKDHPVTGVGFGGYQHALLTEYKRFLPANAPITLSHTAAITIAAEQGLVGVTLFGGFLAVLAWEVMGALRRRSAWRSWIVLPALLVVPILLYSQLEGRLIEEPYLWVAIGLLYAARCLEGSTPQLRLPR